MRETEGRRPTLSLFNLFVLFTGFTIGFAPIQWWRSRQPPQAFDITIHRADVRTDELRELGLPNSNIATQMLIPDIDAIVELLISRTNSDPKTGYWTTTFPYSVGYRSRWQNGGGIEVPVMRNDGGVVSLAVRYEGDTIIAEAEELSNGNILLSFDISNHSLDYGDPQRISGTRVFPHSIRQLNTQIEIQNGTFTAVPTGKHTDKDGIEREFILILSAKRTNLSR